MTTRVLTTKNTKRAKTHEAGVRILQECADIMRRVAVLLDAMTLSPVMRELVLGAAKKFTTKTRSTRRRTKN